MTPYGTEGQTHRQRQTDRQTYRQGKTQGWPHNNSSLLANAGDRKTYTVRTTLKFVSGIATVSLSVTDEIDRDAFSVTALEFRSSAHL